MTELPPKGKAKKNRGTGPASEHYELSGDFRGAVINIKSTVVGSAEVLNLENVPPEPGDPPFQGLQYFDEDDAGRFFGRELLTARIISRMHRSRFLAIIGASGSGKSSLVRAGVIPALKKGTRLEDGGLPPPGSGNWGIHLFTPGARPLEALALGLVSPGESLSSIAALAQEFEADPHALRVAIKRYLSTQSKNHLLLVVDQFEELFTLSRRAEEREAFLNTLVRAADPEENLEASILIVLRADYYAQVAQHDSLREVVSQHQEFIGAMDRAELVRAIDRPLALGDWQIQEGLIEVILDDVGYEPGALPLLSHALLETWERRRGRTLTLSGYREAGGVRGAIAETAETVFRSQLTAEQQPIARMIFIRLTEVGEDSSDTRRRAAFSELITRATDERTIELVVKILSDSRLVITGTAKPGDVKVIEVAHEAIIREWPTLREWLEEDREGLILHQNLSEDAAEWERLGQDPGILYRGTRLERAQAWADASPDSINLAEQDFLNSSQRLAAEEAAQKRNLAKASRIQKLSIGIVTVLILMLGYLAYRSFFVRVPAVMDGLFNIAVAQIQGDPQGEVGLTADSLTDAVYSAISDSIAGNPNILVWHDGPELAGKSVEVGTVDALGEGSETAESKAERLKADMVIFGNYDLETDPPRVVLKYYLAPQDGFFYEDLEGTFALGEFQLTGEEINLIRDGSPPSFSNELSSLALIAAGFSEGQLGRSLEALEAFLQADEATPGSDTIQFFIGREYLFLVDREAVLDVAREEFEAEAESAFLEASRLNPDNPRPHIGLGGVYFKRARDKLEDSLTLADRADSLRAAFDESGRAISEYETAVKLAQIHDNSDVPLEVIARLGLGNATRLRGDILLQQGDYEGAGAAIDQAIVDLRQTLVPLGDAELDRYLAQAFEYLGGTFTTLGALSEIGQDFEGSLEAYRTALNYYDQCIELGNQSLDLIIQREIAEKICIPGQQAVQEILDDFSGGQG